MSVMTRLETPAPSDSPRFPGGYVFTPAKRKREIPRPAKSEAASMLSKSTAGSGGRPWSVKEWKALERIYKNERELWMSEREVKPLPGGLVAWARRSTMGREVDVAEWDAERVVRRFLAEQGVGETGKGEWER
jgi:serine/arginine repetitive matrix protein 2